ncbi:MAG TPA: ABC transporter substrate-binding protein [Steroidobacteraceae bacterium]|jgi:NitT/TauT family transport system substrate-binding protein
MSLIKRLGSLLFIAAVANAAHAGETIRVAIGTQDTTINCATGGLLIRELNLLQKYLPHDGRYRNVTYDVQWANFTSGAPLTGEMVAGKLDIGAMADFPGVNNGAAFLKANKRSVFISVLSGSILGSGNGIVVPLNSKITSLSQLKGHTISVPFASTAHGMLLRAIAAQGWDPQNDVNVITQAPEVAGPALQAGKIEAHADFVPFAELFEYRGIARKIFDGAQTNAPTFHGALVSADYAQKYPEVVVAYLRAALEADRLVTADPEKFSLLVEKVTGIEAAVNYLYYGPLGLQTRDFTWKPEYRRAVTTAIQTLTLLGRPSPLQANTFIDDRYIRAAFKASGLDYDTSLANYAKSPLHAKDAVTGRPITDVRRAAGIWLRDEPKVRHYASIESALSDLRHIQQAGRPWRAVYVQDLTRGIKLLAPNAWYATEAGGQLSAFLQKDDAAAYATTHGGRVLDFAGAQAAAQAQRSGQVSGRVPERKPS